ncbi:MAG: hypothetical protein WDZ42_01310 [Candidatus Saccharimonadales bacterium]
MPDQVQLRGGTEADNNAFTGVAREVTVDTTNKTLRIHDGTTAGGSKLAAYDAWGRLQVADPIDDSDVVNKGYVDGVVEGSVPVFLEPVEKTDTFTESVAPGAESADITGLALTTTPGSVDDWFVLYGFVTIGIDSPMGMSVILYQSIGGAMATPVLIGSEEGNRQRVTMSGAVNDADSTGGISISGILVKPNTMDEIVWTFRLMHRSSGTRTVYVNRPHINGDNNWIARGASLIGATRLPKAGAA